MERALLSAIVLGTGVPSGSWARCVESHRCSELAPPDLTAAGETGTTRPQWLDHPERPDVVVIAPGYSGADAEANRQFGENCLSAGCHLLLDAGVAWTSDTLRALAATARMHERTIKLGSRLRHRIAIQRGIDHVLDGDVGMARRLTATLRTRFRPDAGVGEPLSLALQLLDIALDARGPIAAVRATHPSEPSELGRPIDRLRIEAQHTANAGASAMPEPWSESDSIVEVTVGGEEDVFDLEIRGTTGGVAVSGLGRDYHGGDDAGYGVETLFYMQEPRRPGKPAERTRTPHEMPDGSYDMDWDDMVGGCLERRAPMYGHLERIIELADLRDALLTSARRDGEPIATASSGRPN